MNTYFKHKPSKKWTWRSSGDRQMIDYIIIDRRWRSCISNARSYPSAIVPNVENDHNFVLANFKVRFNVQKRTHTKKLDIEKLRIPGVKKRYEIEIKDRFEALSSMIEEASLDQALYIVNRTISKTAEVIGFKRYRREPWISDEVLNLADQRRKIQAKMSITPQDDNLKQNNTQLKNVINIKVEECRNEWFNKLCYEAEEASRKNDIRSLFQKVKTLKKGIKLNDKCGSIRDKDVTIPKKGDTTTCETYRTISLICHASKIILDIIRRRMKNTI
ncbi:hypothetical protein ACJMK2_007674 [Sinanodonta woodiana]|uniref:Uncharacterized protein n=1 Tax=Sinanodonta woodiana TaxID=1069815 RepID=A0ABD3VJ86_SINWO